MTTNDSVEFREARRRGWLRDRPRKNCDLHNAYYHWCKANDRPFVQVLQRKRYAAVSIDMFSVDRDLNERAIDAVKDLLTPFLTRHKFIAYGRTYSVAHDVPIEQADDLAGQLLKLASDPANTRGISWGDR